MGILILVGFLLVFLVVIVMSVSHTEPASNSEEKLPSEFIAAMSVAGINKNGCEMKHVGAFIGKLVAEPDNVFDEKAIKVVHEDGTHLGYIKAAETDAVREMIGKNFKRYPVVGQVKFVEETDQDDDEETDANEGYFMARVYIDSAHL